MNEFELLMAEAFDDGMVTEVIRPSAIVPEEAARGMLVELTLRDVRSNGVWHASPSMWRRYAQPCAPGETVPPETALLGTIQVAYGTPTRYEITIYRATVTRLGNEQGWTVERLCDEALAFGGLTLASCPRADLGSPPTPFRFERG